MKATFMRIGLGIAAGLIVLILPGAAQAEPPDRSPEARRVFEALARIEAEAAAPGVRSMRRLEVTEAQLNAYAACRIAEEAPQVLRELALKLFPGNKIEGKVGLDFGQAGSGGFGAAANLFFAGRIESERGLIRLHLDGLYLEGRKVSTALLDLAIALGSRIEGTEPFSLADWIPLPGGMERLEVEAGRLIAVY